MDAEKTTGSNPMLLATCLMAGIGIGILSHVLMGDDKNTASATACGVLDVAGLNKMVAQASAASSGKDATRLMALYDDQASVIGTAPGEWLKGRSQLMAGIEAMMMLQPRFHFTPKDQGISCAQAWSAGDAQMTWVDRTSGQNISADYRYTLVYRFTQGGWKIAHMHLSAPEKAHAN